MLRTASAALLSLVAAACGAAEFSVTPIRLELEPGVRSAAVTVVNDDAQPLRLELKLMQWTQDAAGLDVYTESDALIYFPKQMSVQPNERRLVRVGLKSAPGAAERSYRLFLDQLPEAAQAGASGLSFSVRFALPIFLPAAAAQPPRGAIRSVALEDGKLSVGVANTGNQHFRITSVTARGADGFGAELAGWYLLPGAQRVHTLDIPSEACRRLRRLEVMVMADKLSLEGGLDVEPRMCGR